MRVTFVKFNFTKLKFIAGLVLLALPIVPLSLSLTEQPTQAKPGDEDQRMSEDQVGEFFKFWAGKGDKAPLREPIAITEVFTPNEIGRVVLSRDVVKGSGFLGATFTAQPGNEIVLTGWGSKIEGCFAEVAYQIAHTTDLMTAPIVPVLLELGVGGQPIEIKPYQKQEELVKAIAVAAAPYTYTVYNPATGQNAQYEGRWYVARNVFPFGVEVANIFRRAPGEEVKARVTLATADPRTGQLVTRKVTFKVEKKVVQHWKRVYEYNPNCTNLDNGG